VVILIFLLEGHRHYDFMEATVVQGLQHCNHIVYGHKGNAANYLTPHEGQDYGAVIQCLGNGELKKDEITPFIFLFGGDTGQAREGGYVVGSDRQDADIYFVRDLRGGVNPRVLPINFGIEDRYFCATPKKGHKPLVHRKTDICFFGRFDNAPGRRNLLHGIADEFGKNYAVRFLEQPFTEQEGFWSKWVQGHCTHVPKYYRALANSKIILSPMGAGPDCARHWEAMASGGIPLIQFMPTVPTPPRLRHGIDSMIFKDEREAITIIRKILDKPEEFQNIADHSFFTACRHHTTKARAEYMLNECKRLGVLAKC
jgi:hypothetical protein